jgi:sugar lactone lactonase YvrE
LRSPVGVATGDDTDLYVLDEATSIVKEFSPQGHWVRDLKVAGPLSLDSGVLVSQCLAHDRGGGLLVSDARQGVVHRLGPAGHALEDLRVPADASGRLEAIYAAADSQGNIYVATRPGAVIRKYGSDRRLLWERGFDTTGSYPFSESVRAITVGPRDRLWVWVLDYRMLVFDHNGQYATERSQEKWGEPVAGAFDRQGNRYEVWFETVAGYGTDLIKFDSDGQQLWRHNWVAVRGTGLTVTADGHAFVTLQDYKFTAAPCVEVSPDGEEIRLIGSNGTRLGEVRDPSGLAIDAAGNLYVGDYYAYRVQRFGSDGKFLGEVIGPGIPRSSTQQIEAPDGFGAPSSIAVDAARRIHVTHYDGLDQMLSVFSLAGASESGLPKIPLGYGGYTDTHFGASPRFPASVALDAAGNIWTAMGVEPQLVEGKAEPGSDHLRGGGVRVSKYDPTGKMVLSFGGYGSGPGLFGRHDKEGVSASLLAIGGEGTVWVVDRGNIRVQQFDREGRFLGQIGPEVGGLVLDRPWGAVVDERAHVYVADQRYIFECSPNGAFVAAVAILDESPSADRDEFLSRYRGIAVDQSGSIYITDAARESVRRFAPRAGIDG